MSTDKKKSALILQDKNIYKGLIILSLPLMVNNLLRTLHDIVDMFFVARIEGLATESVSAIQLSFPVMFTFVALGIGLSVAGTALISQLIGAKKRRPRGSLCGSTVLGGHLNEFSLLSVSLYACPVDSYIDGGYRVCV